MKGAYVMKQQCQKLEELVKIRKAKHITMKTLAEATGTTGNTIWRIENGRANPSWELAIKIAKYLGCSLDVFKPTVVSAQDDKENNPGFQLYLLRKKAGYKSQTALAKAIGVSRITISDWERDKYYPQGNNLINLAKVLKVSTSYLFSILLPSADQHHNKCDTEQLLNGPFFVTQDNDTPCIKAYNKRIAVICDKYIRFSDGDCVRNNNINYSRIYPESDEKQFTVYFFSIGDEILHGESFTTEEEAKAFSDFIFSSLN